MYTIFGVDTKKQGKILLQGLAGLLCGRPLYLSCWPGLSIHFLPSRGWNFITYVLFHIYCSLLIMGWQLLVFLAHPLPFIHIFFPSIFLFVLHCFISTQLFIISSLNLWECGTKVTFLSLTLPLIEKGYKSFKLQLMSLLTSYYIFQIF